jgi:ribokinase
VAQQPVVVVVGSFMMDLVVKTERRPGPGETVVGQEFGMYPGGKGVNQAVTARRMGAEVYMVGRVGTDSFGDIFLQALEEEGVRTRYIVRDAEQGTGVGAPVVDASGQNAIVIIPRANMAVTAEDVDRARPALEQAQVIVLQNEIAHAANLRAAEIARQLGKTIIYNPAPARAGVDDLLALVDIVTPNESEMRALTGIDPCNPEEAARAAAALLAKGPRAVVVTMGANGALVADEHGAQHIPAYRVQVVDTTGAGDAFNGALALSLASGLPLAEAVQVGGVAGALAVTKMGAVPSMPSRDQVRAFWEEREMAAFPLG